MEKEHYVEHTEHPQEFKIPGINAPFDALRDGPPLAVLLASIMAIRILWKGKRRLD